MSKLIERLEQALKMWEDVSCAGGFVGLAGAHLLGIPTRSAFVIDFWRDLREYLISFRGESFDLNRFQVPAEEAGSNLSFPASLAAWTAFSRCAYQIDPPLQAMFELTPLNNLHWEDIPWPYRAFCITLKRPIANLEGEPCDLIMVSRRIYSRLRHDIREDDLELRLIPRSVANVPRLTRSEIRRWDRYREKREWGHLKDETVAFIKRFRRNEVEDLQVFQFRARPNELIADGLDDLLFSQPNPSQPVEEPPTEITIAAALALRISLGLALYLSTLPTRSSELVYEQEPGTRSQVKPITSGADVCRVLSNFKLTTEEMASLGGDEVIRAYHEVAPHWRRGHFRRPWGQGKNPSARRTVWIRPVMVRKDRLASNAQVGGAQVNVD